MTLKSKFFDFNILWHLRLEKLCSLKLVANDSFVDVLLRQQDIQKEAYCHKQKSQIFPARFRFNFISSSFAIVQRIRLSIQWLSFYKYIFVKKIIMSKYFLLYTAWKIKINIILVLLLEMLIKKNTFKMLSKHLLYSACCWIICHIKNNNVKIMKDIEIEINE